MGEIIFSSALFLLAEKINSDQKFSLENWNIFKKKNSTAAKNSADDNVISHMSGNNNQIFVQPNKLFNETVLQVLL